MSESGSPIEIYRQEAEELLGDIETTVLDLEQNPQDRESIDRLFRSVHTIKGSGAMFGFDEISAFTHHVETILDHIRNGDIAVSNRFINLILVSRDHIKALLDASDGDCETDSTVSNRLIQELYQLLPEKMREDFTDRDDEEAKGEIRKTDRIWRIRFQPHAGIIQTGNEPGILLDELREMGECRVIAHSDAVPPLEDLHPEHCYFSWDILLTCEEKPDIIRDIFVFVEEESRISIKEISKESAAEGPVLVPRLGDILVERGDARPEDINRVLKPHQKQIGELLVEAGIVSQDKVYAALTEQQIYEKRKSGTALESSIRVKSSRLDHLINLVGELVITEAGLARISSIAEDYEESENDNAAEMLEQIRGQLQNVTENLERLTRDLRDCALDMRMLPIGTIFGRFRRLVRDLCLELEKEIELVTEGGDTELDKTVIERMSDPLVHLIRNSIDHGIRKPEIREKYGKKRSGTIRISAAHRGPNVLITIEDDGMGMDADKIRHKALEKGLIGENESLSQEETFSLVFTPGFSTAKSVTSVSGRGVGLDVVKREIESLGGTVRISSKKGSYTRFSLTLPLTLAIIDGLLVDAGGSFFVLPLAQVLECLELSEDMITTGRGRDLIRLREEIIPFVRLCDIYGIPGRKTESEHIAVVQSDEYRIGIVVDEIIGNIQTVIKSLDRNYRNAEGISGATIMGDGTVALISDIPDIIRLARKDEKRKLETN
ncbi:MAG: chemotaxis protein CheA [Desulfococcaceae bacterium]|jgi:two-component system chemotaxis sensor kinase CheA|nr:chemotaxis protein CheA [Desulfococcaceae bacterium]